MKNYLKIFTMAGILWASVSMYGANDDLKVNYLFGKQTGNVIQNEVSNSYNATLLNGAEIKKVGRFSVLNLGDSNGYLDLGSELGELISGLSTFTLSTYIFISDATDLTANGNFVFTFSNSTDIGSQQNGCSFFSARVQRYAITKTHWGGETAIETGKALNKGEWKHITLTQNGTKASLYVDGELAKRGKVTLLLKDLGKTIYNFIGRSCYVGDAYLKNTLISDFRIYNTELTENEVKVLAQDLPEIREAYAEQEIIEAKESLTINNGKSDVIQNIALPSYSQGVPVTWSSSNERYISNLGAVTRPSVGSNAVQVVLTAKLSKNGRTLEKTFTLNVLPSLSDKESVDADMNTLASAWIETCVRKKITLAKSGVEGSVISWKSNNPGFITNDGAVLKLSDKGSGDKLVSLKATCLKNGQFVSKDFNVCIKEDEGYSAYLFAYFTGNSGDEEAVRFALSRDGYNYKALNSNKPIIASDTISDKGGVRDPHILRGEDGNFYMVITDMKSDQGWSSNHGIILMKSADLVNWSHSKIDIKARYSAFSNIQSAWAPQTIYDPEVGKYMIYWSMRSPGVHEIIYYAYANDDFTDIEGEPQVLFNHPDSKSTIDGDIIYKDGKYNLFFKTEGDGNGIKKAVSDKLTSGYVIQDQYLQQTTQAVEGSCVFRLINSDEYILMYDVYVNGRYEFTESTDLDNFSKIEDNRISMDFHPRHGTVIPITEEEGERLMQKWGNGTNVLEIFGSSSDAVKMRNWIKEGTEIILPARSNSDLTAFDPELITLPGVNIMPQGAQNFSSGAVEYQLSANGNVKKFNVKAQVNANPVLDGYYADPEVLYSEKNNKYYIYPTTDGFPGWGSSSFKTFSSPDLVNWTDEGEILVLGKDVKWADKYAWAPCIIEKKIGENDYRYYYYFTARQKIGVAVASDPTGPFVDKGEALIKTRPAGVSGGQEIDPDVFFDPVSQKGYLYWGNGYLAVAELNDDMMSVKENTTKVMTPSDNTFREGIYVFYRNGQYYFVWSEDDTGSENYKVRYGISNNPLGSISIPDNNIVIQKNLDDEIYATGHNSILQIPNKDEWYIVYHRFARPGVSDPGQHREVCIDRLEFNADGTIKQTIPTLEGITKLGGVSGIEYNEIDASTLNFTPNPAFDRINVQGVNKGLLYFYDSLGKMIKEKQISNTPQDIYIGDLASGAYILVAVDDMSKVYKNRLIKK